MILLFLPLSAVPAGLAGASVVNTTDTGASELLLPVSGLPARFNVSVPAGSVVTSFTLAVSTAPSASAPEVPADVSLDLGLDGVDWAFGGGAEGAFGYQQRLSDGTSQGSLAVGAGPASFEFLLPRGADVTALRFLATPRVNMSLWNSSEFVTVLVNATAVPLNLTADAAPAVGDLGLDGRVDLIATGADGALHLYSRVGSSGLLFEENTTALPSNLTGGQAVSSAVLADLNRDGAPDIIVGSRSAGLFAYLTGNLSARDPLDLAEDGAIVSGIPAYPDAAPALGDLDGDLDLDLVVGASDGSLVHFRNEIGEGTGVAWRAMNTLIGAGLSVSSSAAPALTDLDGDGDVDLVVGSGDGSVAVFENTGSPAVPTFSPEGALDGLVPIRRAAPSLVDWTQDGRPDLFYGAGSGLVYFAESLGGLPADLSVTVSGGGGPVTVAPGNMAAPVQVDLPPSALSPLATALLPLQSDAWGNALEEVTVALDASHFGQVDVTALEVEYTARLPLPDLGAALRTFAAGAAPVGNRTVVPFHLSGAPLVPATAPAVRVSEILATIDDAPAFSPLPALFLDEDTAQAHLVDLSAHLADEDAANATFSILAATNATYVTLSIADGRFLSADAATGDLNDNWTGSVEFVVRAHDARGQPVDSATETLRVQGVPDAPIVEFIAAQYLGPNDALSVAARAIDGDPGAALRWSLLPPSPASARVDPLTGDISWNPSSNERGAPARIVVAVTDGSLADTQAFDVYFVPVPQPVFGKTLPRVSILPGRPEFINLFDFATGNVSSIRSVTLSGPAHPYVNLSADGEWVAFDTPADALPGSIPVVVEVNTTAGDESVALEASVLPVPAGLNLAPFPPTPLSRGIQHRFELLRYASRITDFRNLSFEVAHSFATVSGFNLSLFVPTDYAGTSLLLPVTVRAGNESASAVWTVLLASGTPAPRVGRVAIVSGGARDVDLSYAFGPGALESQRFPLSTDSPRLSPLGLAAFRVSFPPWPERVPARDFWPIDRVRVFDAHGAHLLEVEIGFDGRSRLIDRVQYFAEDAEAVIDGSFALKEELVGAHVSNTSLAGTGPLASGPLESIVRLDGSAGVGWRATFTRDTRLEQITVVALTDDSGAGGSLSYSVWAVVAARDDAPTYKGGLADIKVEPGFNKTVDLSKFFGDEEDDDLTYALSAQAAGVALDRSSGWLVVDGSVAVNLTAVRVTASESKSRFLTATSGEFNIRVEAAQGPPPGGAEPATAGLWEGWTLPLLLVGALAAAGAGAFVLLMRRRDDEDDAADDDVDGVVGALADAERWESVPHARPPPSPPPNPEDPQMQLLEAEWSRVIASRHTDATSAADDTDSEFTGRMKPGKPAGAGPHESPEPEARPAKMASSDTETERRAGETDAEIDVKKRRLPR